MNKTQSRLKTSEIPLEDYFFDFFQFFLSNRVMRCVLNGNSSRSFCITADVPQDSAIEPILFFILDLHHDH